MSSAYLLMLILEFFVGCCTASRNRPLFIALTFFHQTPKFTMYQCTTSLTPALVVCFVGCLLLCQLDYCNSTYLPPERDARQKQERQRRHSHEPWVLQVAFTMTTKKPSPVVQFLVAIETNNTKTSVHLRPNSENCSHCRWKVKYPSVGDSCCGRESSSTVQMMLFQQTQHYLCSKDGKTVFARPREEQHSLQCTDAETDCWWIFDENNSSELIVQHYRRGAGKRCRKSECSQLVSNDTNPSSSSSSSSSSDTSRTERRPIRHCNKSNFLSATRFKGGTDKPPKLAIKTGTRDLKVTFRRRQPCLYMNCGDQEEQDDENVVPTRHHHVRNSVARKKRLSTTTSSTISTTASTTSTTTSALITATTKRQERNRDRSRKVTASRQSTADRRNVEVTTATP